MYGFNFNPYHPKYLKLSSSTVEACLICQPVNVSIIYLKKIILNISPKNKLY